MFLQLIIYPRFDRIRTSFVTPISGPWVPPTAVTYGLVAGKDGKYCEDILEKCVEERRWNDTRLQRDGGTAG